MLRHVRWHDDTHRKGLNVALMTVTARPLRRLHWSLLRRIAPTHPFLVRFDGDLQMRLRPIDRFGKAIFVLGGNSDPHLAALLEAFLMPGMTCFDVGAHIGQFTLIAAKRVGPTGAVHSFEASGPTYQQLLTNVALNNLSQVVTNHAAACDYDGHVELKTCRPGKEAFNSIGRPLRPEDQIVGVERVPAIALDDYIRQHGIKRVDLMKVDVEGAELLVLRGARQLLADNAAPAMVIEFSDKTASLMGSSTGGVRRELEGMGYELFSFNAATRRLVPEPDDRSYQNCVNLVATKDQGAFQAVLDRQRSSATPNA